MEGGLRRVANPEANRMELKRVAAMIVLERNMRGKRFLAGGMIVAISIALMLGPAKGSTTEDDEKTVASLDTKYQAAVKGNDAATMEQLLDDNFTLVTGSGTVYTKADLVNEARNGTYVYEHQEDSAQTVRVWGNTAVITAKLWAQGTKNGKPFDYTVWFSDTYVRTPSGWRYVFGQSGLPVVKSS